MHNERQRYQCQQCGAKFQDRKRSNRLRKQIWNEYVEGKQTLKQVSHHYHRSIRSVQTYLDQYQPKSQHLIPCAIVLIIDAFYFGRHIGVMLFRAANLKRNLHWFSVPYETITDYIIGIDHLERAGWLIQAVVCDGRKGVKDALNDRYPIQMCHFHQLKLVTKHLTRRPQLEAGQHLRAIALTLAHTNEATFARSLAGWYAHWAEFLKERTVDPTTGRWSYTHRRVRAAYRSLAEHLPYLFTYQKYPHLHIPNTTNSLDGSISHLRDKLRAHRGLQLTRRLKITGELLKGKSP